jgi:hypothetical protein
MKSQVFFSRKIRKKVIVPLELLIDPAPQKIHTPMNSIDEIKKYSNIEFKPGLKNLNTGAVIFVRSYSNGLIEPYRSRLSFRPKS